MHPKWQKRILKYYQDLLTVDGKQTVQLVVATHSPYIVEEAIKDPEDTLVIILKEKDRQIEVKYLTDIDFITKTSAEVNYVAFDISSVDYHQMLYAHLQDSTNKNSKKECDEYIEKSCHYNKTEHEKLSSHNKTNYKTLPTYVRNAIGHPYEKDKSGNRRGKKKEYNEDDLRTSIELMRKIQDNSPATSSQWLSWTFSARCDIMALC